MKINPGNARGLLVPQGDRPFSFVVYSSEIRDFGVQASREAERKTLKKRDLECEDKLEIVGEVLLDMPRETVTAQTVEIMERFKKKNLPASWKTAERALKKYREMVGARKPCSVMLS